MTDGCLNIVGLDGLSSVAMIPGGLPRNGTTKLAGSTGICGGPALHTSSSHRLSCAGCTRSGSVAAPVACTKICASMLNMMSSRYAADAAGGYDGGCGDGGGGGGSPAVILRSTPLRSKNSMRPTRFLASFDTTR